MAQVEYRVKVKGIECNEPICFQPNLDLSSNSGITNVEISFTDFDSDYYSMIIKVTINNNHAQVEEFISKILSLFSYEFGMLYKDLTKISDSRSVAIGMVTLYNNSDYHLLGKTDCEDIINNLGDQIFEADTLGNSFVSILVNSLRIEGVVGRFIQLYGLLQMVVPTSDLSRPTSQRDVDSFIRGNNRFSFYDVNEDKPTTRPNGSGNDTIYTWLRNQVGHTGSNVDVADVQNQIEDKVNELFIITKTAINNFKM
ncbi:hypothetical protein COM90_29995 [Bacillus thuringiensis]|uniref:Uncharacterized protein n=1 Tax=Bacillus thuringiensis TaxID=1428 RepID=A0AB36TLE5_BACTU|nr:hypothetical protein [Bacillus thuringiensis]PEE62851.1 hypothetical protein COM74_22210 [Bacillus thuringiensis]PEE85188.1 hypothetical protein COM90_29995 [Bacillus thuringiensis]PFM84186.1 hypothetical protein COJ61_30450 [Bacillus thuringiensis]